MFALRVIDKDLPVAVANVRLFNSYTHRNLKKNQNRAPLSIAYSLLKNLQFQNGVFNKQIKEK